MANNINSKNPLECSNIDEVRHEIDNIDREIIRLLSVRTGYVHEVVKYKDGTAAGIEAPERRAAVLRTRREWAEACGFDADITEELYRRIVQYYISEEMKLVNDNAK